MPIYEYRCQECEHTFEELVKSTEPAAGEVHCAKCDSTRVDKLLSVFGVANAAPGRTPPAGPCGSSCACFPQ